MTTHRTMRALAATAVAAALLAAPGVAAAQETADRVSADADVDGDGTQERATLEKAAPGTQLLRVELPGGALEGEVHGDEGLPLIVPFVVDVDGDGRDELVLGTSLGANTTTFELWSVDDGRLHAVTAEDGTPWRLHEGGGATALAAYGCVPGTPGRQLRTVQAALDDAASGDGTPRFDGALVTWAVTGGVAHPATTADLQDVTRDDPRTRLDPATCTPPA